MRNILTIAEPRQMLIGKLSITTNTMRRQSSSMHNKINAALLAGVKGPLVHSHCKKAEAR